MEIAASRLVYDSERVYRSVIEHFLTDHPECADDLEQLFFSWGNIEETVKRASFLVSLLPRCEDDNRPLITAALHDGIIAGSRLAGYQAYTPFLTAFVKRLGKGLAESSIYGMSADGRQEKWELCCPFICQWAASYDTIVVIENESVSPAVKRATELLLTARLLTARDLALQIEQGENISALPHQEPNGRSCL